MREHSYDPDAQFRDGPYEDGQHAAIKQVPAYLALGCERCLGLCGPTLSKIVVCDP